MYELFGCCRLDTGRDERLENVVADKPLEIEGIEADDLWEEWDKLLLLDIQDP